MNHLTSGTTYRDTAAGIIAVHGKRELHLLGTSVADQEKARRLLAGNSFNSLFARGFKMRALGNNVAAIKVSA